MRTDVCGTEPPSRPAKKSPPLRGGNRKHRPGAAGYYSHYFRHFRTINWRAEKTGKNKWAEFLSGTPKTGLHANEQGHSRASNRPRFLRQNGFLDCNPKAWLSGGVSLP